MLRVYYFAKAPIHATYGRLMLKFLFAKRPQEEEAVAETQRETLVRLVRELNEALAALPEKPRVIVDPETGELDLDLPETLPDEALALPAPQETETDSAKRTGDEPA